MGFGWYGAPENLGELVNSLFDIAEHHTPLGGAPRSQDDFAIALESGEFQPHAIDDWRHSSEPAIPPGIITLRIGDDVPRGGNETI